MCCYFTIYKSKIPANTEVYLNEFRKLISFEMASPIGLIDYFYPNFNIEEKIANEEVKFSGVQ